MIDLLSRITHLAEHALARVKVSSALNPVLWLAASVCPLGLVALLLADSVPGAIAGLVMIVVPIGLFVYAYVFFMHTSPDKLRSEDYELRKLALEIVEEKGGRIQIAPASVEAISNSEYRSLKEPEVEEAER